VDGSTSTYRLYKSGEPDDDKMCFVINCNNTEEMEDEYCDDNNRYVCKAAAGNVIIPPDLWWGALRTVAIYAAIRPSVYLPVCPMTLTQNGAI